MSVPFFSDFTKKTKDFFKTDKYALGQVVEISQKCGSDIKLKAKISNAGAVKSKFTATLKRPNNREIEITEDLKKGMTLKVKVPALYKSLDIESEHTNGDVEVTAKYRPNGANAFWNAKASAYYNPSLKGSRVCRSTASFAVGDDQLNLSVGGQMTVEDSSKNEKGAMRGADPYVKGYKLGFLYTPTKESLYSVIYTPDEDSNGMEYSFTAFRRMSEQCSLAVRAEGKVDTKLTSFPPTVALSGGWTVGGGNYLQAFVNSRKEWGMAYKVKVSQGVNLNLGVAAFLNDGRMDTQFGYKLQV